MVVGEIAYTDRLYDGATRSSPPDEAYFICALASYAEVKAASGRCDRSGTAASLLAATASECEGDLLRAESTLRYAVERASESERPYVVDLLASLLISRGLFSRAGALLGSAVIPPHLEIGRLALHAVVDAATGNVRSAERHSSAAREAIARVDDAALRMRVHQRLALAAHYRGAAAEALDEVARGLRVARALAAHRAACALHAIAYATYHSLTGDVDAARRRAYAILREAELGGDVARRTSARIAIYELAAERGDDTEVAAARAALAEEPFAERYRERFAGAIADVLRLGWKAEFAACGAILAGLHETPGRTDGERALCRALHALVSAGLGDADAARRFGRQAISTSTRAKKHSVASELRYRHLARALAAIAGDIVRGRCDSSPDRIPENVRGYARFVEAVRTTLGRRPPTGPLTDSEAGILRMLASGNNAPQIAAILGRSPHTVRTHIRNASAKLESRGRVEMLARARHLGIVTFPTHVRRASRRARA